MENGIDLQLWLALGAVILLFIVFPGFALEYERRKRERTGAPMTGYPGLPD